MSVSKGLVSPYSPVAVLIFTVVFMLASAIILKYPWYSFALAAYIFVFTAFPYLYGEKSRDIKDFINWSIAYASGREQMNGYILPLSILMYAMISFAIYLFAVRLKVFYIAIAIGLIVFAIQWYGFIDHAYRYMLYFITVSLVYYTVAKQPGQVVDVGVLGWGFMASVVIMGTSHFMPVNLEPVSWQRLDQWVQDTFPIVRTLRGGDTVGVTVTGFSEGPQHLGGPAVADNRVVFYIKTTADTLYLRGAVYDTYDGKTWGKSHEQWMENSGGTIPLMYGKNVRGKNVSIEIIEDQLKTNVLFSVLQPVYVKTPDGTFTSDEDMQLRYRNELKNGYKYTITAFQPIVDPKEMRTYRSLKIPVDMEKYLQIPKELPQRVKDLAHQITDIYDSPFDKAMAIQTYLRQFAYDLNVSVTPPNRDFVDYFLFDLKKGYCTYYASAMTIMLRSIGIPARYVTGFVYQSTQDESKKGDYEPVTNASAHAWVEAYFPGYGWINFEPTPFYFPMYFETSYSSSSAPWMMTNPMAGWYNGYGESNVISPDYTKGSNAQSNSTNKGNTDTKQKQAVKSGYKAVGKDNTYLRFVYVYVLVLITFVLVALMVWNVVLKRRNILTHMSPRERALWQFEEILRMLEKKGFAKRTGETILEFADRISKHLEYDINFHDVALAFNRIRYAKELQNGDIEILRKFYYMVARWGF